VSDRSLTSLHFTSLTDRPPDRTVSPSEWPAEGKPRWLSASVPLWPGAVGRSLASTALRSTQLPLTHSLTHSLTRSLTHSLAHPLTHSLTRSLSCPLSGLRRSHAVIWVGSVVVVRPSVRRSFVRSFVRLFGFVSGCRRCFRCCRRRRRRSRTRRCRRRCCLLLSTVAALWAGGGGGGVVVGCWLLVASHCDSEHCCGGC